MTVLLLVADGGAAERISRRGREIFVGSEANMSCAALVINMHKMLLSSESLAAHDECVFFFFPQSIFNEYISDFSLSLSSV